MILHHGNLSKQFDVEYIGTDYFAFWHKPCKTMNTSNHGHSLPKYLVIDNEGRVIFHLRCLDCGFEDALKTHLELWETPGLGQYERIIKIEDTLFKRLMGIKAWWSS